MTDAKPPATEPAGPYERYLAVRHFGSLDGLRCLSIVAVVFHHGVDEHHELPLVAQLGFLGVDLFFVLSGFLIVTLLLREKRSRGRISLSRFYVRRVLRIFPAYFGLLLALGLVYAFVAPNASTAAGYWELLPFYLTFTSNWVIDNAANLGVLWSLAAEEQFYLVWPAVEKVLPNRWVWAVLAVVLAVNQAVNFRLIDGWLRAHLGVGHADLSMLQITFTPIALGVCLAHLLDQRSTFMRVYTFLAPRWSPLAAFAILGILVNLGREDIAGWQRLTIQLAMAFLLASVVVREDHAARRFLAWRPVAFVGSISYGMYLYHMWALHVVREGLKRSPVRVPGDLFLLGLGLTVVVAAVSYYLYERRFLRLKGRFG
jgi:peptidoglycan/LPS O-acetylase OafA/YrhL